MSLVAAKERKVSLMYRSLVTSNELVTSSSTRIWSGAVWATRLSRVKGQRVQVVPRSQQDVPGILVL